MGTRVVAVKPFHDLSKTAGQWKEHAVAALGPIIVVVDDEPDSRRLVTLTLQRRGYTAFEEATGTEALALRRALLTTRHDVWRPSSLFLAQRPYASPHGRS